MIDALIVSGLVNIASSASWEFAKFGVAKSQEHSCLQKAIAVTADAFPDNPTCSDSLRNWCHSQQFGSLLAQLQVGQRDIVDDSIIQSFVQVTDFFMGDATEEAALLLLSTFVKNLEQELLRSPLGLPLIAERMEVLALQAAVDGQQRTQPLLDQGVALSDKLDNLATAVEQVRQSQNDKPNPDIEQQYRPYYDTLEHSNHLINDGKPMAARTVLQGILLDLKDVSVPGNLLYRIHAQLAFCAYRLGEEALAQHHFALALKDQIPTAKTLILQAVAALLNGELRRAAEFCRAARLMRRSDTDPTNIDATALYLQILDEEGDYDNVNRLLAEEQWIAADVRCTLTLGRIRFGQGDYQGSEAFLRTALSGKERDPLACLELALTLLAPILAQFSTDPSPTRQLSDQERIRVDEADTLLTEAVTALRRHDNPAMLHTALVNRSAVKTVLGMAEEAIRDCDRVLLDDPKVDWAWQNKANALLQLERYEEGIACYEKITNTERRQATLLPLAFAYSMIERWHKVVEVLEPLQTRIEVTATAAKFRTADLLITAYFKTQRLEDAEAIVKEMLTEFPDNPDALSVVARQRRREDNVEAAAELFQRALDHSDGNQRRSILLDFALLYFYRSDFTEAARLFRSYFEVANDDLVFPMYTTSLVNAGFLKEALARAQEKRANGNAIPVITEGEAFVLEFVGDLAKSKELNLQLAEIEPSNPMHTVRAALVALKSGDWDSTRSLIERIKYKDVQNNAKVLMQLAQLRSLLGMSDVLKFAYQARRKAPMDANIQIGYFGVFVDREQGQDITLDAVEVAVDTVVRLRIGNQESVLSIVADETESSFSDEVAVSHKTAQLLLGHHAGDKIQLSDKSFANQEYQVVEIRSKYVAAFQEIASEFQVRFPNQPGISRLDIQDQDFAPLFTMMDANQHWHKQARTLYQEMGLPLGALAQTVHSSLIDTWHHLTQRPDEILLVSGGNAEALNQSFEIIQASEGIVLDLTALLTMKHLGLMDRIRQRFPRALVAQAVLDEVNQAINETKHSKPHMVLGKEGGQHLRQDITSESIQDRYLFLSELRDEIVSQTTVVPVYGILELNRQEYDESASLVGRGSMASVLLAKERGMTLVSDDFGLRTMAANDWQVKGCWTQVVLIELQSKKVVSQEEYNDAVRRFVVSNFRHTFVTSDNLIWILEKNNYVPTDEVTLVMGLFQAQRCNEEAAILVLSDVVKSLWLKPLLPSQKIILLDQILLTLVIGRDGFRVLKRFKQVLMERFYLIPAYLPLLMQDIDIWAQQRVLAV